MKFAITAVTMGIAARSSNMISLVFIDALFLSTYPVSYLPYFYVAQILFFALISFFLNPLIRRGSPYINAVLVFIMATVAIVGTLFIKITNFWFIFAYSVYLSVCRSLIINFNNNILNDAVKEDEYEQVLVNLMPIINLGVIFIGFLIPIIVSFFTIIVLPYIFSFLMCLTAVMFIILGVSPHNIETYSNIKQKKSPFSFPIFRILLVVTFFSLMLFIFSDYLLKMVVTEKFTGEEIGQFMAIFYSSVNFVSLVLQLTIARFILKYGIAPDFYLPRTIIAIGGGILVFFFPMFGFVVALRISEFSCQNLSNMGIQMIMNRLPGHTRRSGRLINTLTANIGRGSAAVILWFLTDWNVSEIAFLIILVSIATLIFVFMIRNYYKKWVHFHL